MTWEETGQDAKDAKLTCPVCGGTEFDQEQGRMDSRWGLTSHKMVLMICRRCRLILQFSAGRGIFDFD
jgi:hypothetical protein